jgi:hypothetical protein
MIIGFNPNYPSLHMREALEMIVSGKADHLGWDAEDIASVTVQAHTLIAERGNSFTQYELTRLSDLLADVKTKFLFDN